MAIMNSEALQDRAGELKAKGLNGMKLILVTELKPGLKPSQAIFEVYFYNNNEIGNFKTDDPAVAQSRFAVSGGQRIRGGTKDNQVKVVKIQEKTGEPTALILTLEPIGDYSTYTLHLEDPKIDPVFSKINVKFRPGCFNNDCAPGWDPFPAPKAEPLIDYLAKDYDSFKHTLINAMKERVPGWQPTSEADLDQVLIDLFSAAGDELSDFQDRVMNEAYLGTARKRVSLARHARLMDYHIHQGNQASTWLAMELKDGEDFTLFPGLQVWAGNPGLDETSVIFMSKEKQDFHYLLNHMGLYTWSDSIPALKAGSTTADLKVEDGTETKTKKVRDLIHQGKIKYLLIQEYLNPATGKPGGVDPGKRQVLKLLAGQQGAKALQDPVTNQWLVRVWWEEADKLEKDYCFTVDCPEGKEEDISFFNGNLVRVFHGRPVEIDFKDPGVPLSSTGGKEYHYEKTEKWGTICRLPGSEPLAYTDTPPGGDRIPYSTLDVKVEANAITDPWEEVINLVHSDDGSERGDHFLVETDELGRSLIRFGNGTNGKELPEEAVVHCQYQVGDGLAGNIGADSLSNFDKNFYTKIDHLWNPFDVTNGRAPEPVAEIIRRVPEAYRYRQLRAVTLKDYEDRAQELPEVSRAAARYAWTGSWRTVRVTVDPKGTTDLTGEVIEKVARHLEAVRLIGEDVEIRPPQWVPLEIAVVLCVHPDYWPEDIKYLLEQEFSEGYLADGRTGFFHPDQWTFGQSLRASQITGRIQAIQGVDHVTSVAINRRNNPFKKAKDQITVAPHQIIQVRNHPDHMEQGSITFEVNGGRQ